MRPVKQVQMASATLYEISHMIIEVYNAVGDYERRPCRCEEYKQDLCLAQQRLQSTLEANRALSVENDRLRARIQQRRQAQKVDRTAAAGDQGDLHRRMEGIEASLHQMMQNRRVPSSSPPPPPPPPRKQHVARHMRSNLEDKLDGKPSLRDRVKAALFEPGEI
jgi:regulator of replication initiation timing